MLKKKKKKRSQFLIDVIFEKNVENIVSRKENKPRDVGRYRGYKITHQRHQQAKRGMYGGTTEEVEKRRGM